MAAHHTKFIRGAIPTKLEKPDPNGRVKVTWQSGTSEVSDEFDTVLFAIGRYALTAGLNMEKAGLKCEKNGKFIVNEYEQTNISNIFAIGDIQQGRLELTPTAIKAGMLLAKRLYGDSSEEMDYTNVPTTVFTPIEYGCVGLSEEDAKAKFGDNNISTYHTAFTPLEW